MENLALETPIAPWRGLRRINGLPVVVAHRGASAGAQESSAASFEGAIAARSDAVETDVRLTADRRLVCHHDATLIRTAGLDDAIADLTFAELEAKAPGICMPLDRVVEVIAGRCNILLDLKLNEAADIAYLMDFLGGLPTDGRITVGVRTLATQRLFADRLPELPLLGLLENPDDVGAFAAAGGVWWRLWEGTVTAERVAAAHALKLPVLVMVGGRGTEFPTGAVTEERIASLLALGVDGFMLDDPAAVTARR
ncbi:MAG TPA: glycerophosphodiester phosphodiesterase family protein [Devosiaceae bacterium]